MLKIIISVYIAAVLLFAGFAEASTSLDIQRLNFQRLNSSKVWLNVSDAKFDSKKETLTLTGHVAPECLNKIQSELNQDPGTNEILVSVVAEGQNCLNQDSNYELAIDLKAYFSEHVLAQDTNVHFIIDNYTGAKNSAFDYLAKQQVLYSFDTVLDGKIEKNQTNGKFYLSHGRTEIQILSRLDLSTYVNKSVQIKGFIPNNFTVGNETAPVLPKFIVGQLITLE